MSKMSILKRNCSQKKKKKKKKYIERVGKQEIDIPSLKTFLGLYQMSNFIWWFNHLLYLCGINQIESNERILSKRLAVWRNR